MITKNYKIPNYKLHYDLDQIGKKENILFLDIETTGFSAKFASIYMIGCCYYKNHDWYIKQWMCENEAKNQYKKSENLDEKSENQAEKLDNLDEKLDNQDEKLETLDEKEILEQFCHFVQNYKILIHFNGNQFDLPFITQRCEHYGLTISFEDFEGIDIYKRIFPYRHFLPLSNCKQKTVEEFMKIKREDIYSGGDLIKVFKSYCKTKDQESLALLLQHNRDDVYGMLQLLPILSYVDLFDEDYHIDQVEIDTSKDVFGKEVRELNIYFSTKISLPRPIACHGNDCYYTGREQRGLIKVPVYSEEMKYFYSDYHDYYYLPMEDSAIHKSVATYVSKEFREQATAANCYTKKSGSFLPQWDSVFTPFFKREYESNNLFFELSDDFKNNCDAFKKYIRHILTMMTSIH